MPPLLRTPFHQRGAKNGESKGLTGEKKKRKKQPPTNSGMQLTQKVLLSHMPVSIDTQKEKRRAVLKAPLPTCPRLSR
jgi:hypothetical protein